MRPYQAGVAEKVKQRLNRGRCVAIKPGQKFWILKNEEKLQSHIWEVLQTYMTCIWGEPWYYFDISMTFNWIPTQNFGKNLFWKLFT